VGLRNRVWLTAFVLLLMAGTRSLIENE
jgi:hypothetical protein